MEDLLERPPVAAPNTNDELDEAFLASIDRAMHLNKLRDPWRLDDVRRAAQEELRANPFGGL